MNKKFKVSCVEIRQLMRLDYTQIFFLRENGSISRYNEYKISEDSIGYSTYRLTELIRKNRDWIVYPEIHANGLSVWIYPKFV